MFIIVSLFNRSIDDIGFIYSVPSELISRIIPGLIVEVPFGKSITYGLITEINVEKNNIKNIKSIESIVYNFPFLYNYQIVILKWISYNYFSLIHKSLCLFFPKNLLLKVFKNKLIQVKEKEIKYDFNSNITLSKAQKEAFEKIVISKNNNIYLFGITGSGKTEIYVNLIQKYILEGKQTLILVPEIILTSQVFNYLVKVFGNEVILINSSVSDTLKESYWASIYSGNAKIIIGTRSAIFYPYKNLGLIIVDEEHDTSYNSDKSPRFNGVELVEKLGKELNIKVVFASGTPSINHMYKALKENYEIINLFEEVKVIQ